MAGGGRSRKKIANDKKKGGKKVERKKTIVTTAKAKKQQQDEQQPHRPSKYVGVCWFKQTKKWEANITIDGKQKSLGYYHDEKEAARIYDEQAPHAQDGQAAGGVRRRRRGARGRVQGRRPAVRDVRERHRHRLPGRRRHPWRLPSC